VRKAGAVWEVKLLKGPLPNTVGRLPLKTTAFDTQYFEDEVTALSPLDSWVFREAGSPIGIGSATKVYQGRDSISLGSARVAALRFGIEVSDQPHIRYHEWYVGGLKVLATSVYLARPEGRDSLRTEEEWIGTRGFTGEDTQTVLKSVDAELAP
jgi:hypothetical protein